MSNLHRWALVGSILWAHAALAASPIQKRDWLCHTQPGSDVGIVVEVGQASGDELRAYVLELHGDPTPPEFLRNVAVQKLPPPFEEGLEYFKGPGFALIIYREEWKGYFTGKLMVDTRHDFYVPEVLCRGDGA